MEYINNNKAAIVITFICFLSAAVITYKTVGNEGRSDFRSGETFWVKCTNNDCRASYEVSKRVYYEYIKEHGNPMSMAKPPLKCKNCGKKTVYKAKKCKSCGYVFFSNSVAGDYSDRCPDCGYSKIEELRKK